MQNLIKTVNYQSQILQVKKSFLTKLNKKSQSVTSTLTNNVKHHTFSKEITYNRH